MYSNRTTPSPTRRPSRSTPSTSSSSSGSSSTSSSSATRTRNGEQYVSGDLLPKVISSMHYTVATSAVVRNMSRFPFYLIVAFCQGQKYCSKFNFRRNFVPTFATEVVGKLELHAQLYVSLKALCSTASEEFSVRPNSSVSTVFSVQSQLPHERAKTKPDQERENAQNCV